MTADATLASLRPGVERPAGRTATRWRRGMTWLPPLFFAALAVPVAFDIGPLRLEPYRILLLLAFTPLALSWISGGLGPLRGLDFLLLGYCLWAAVTLIVNHGLGEMWQYAGMYTVEIFGAYLLARAAIRSPADYRAFVWSFLVFLAVMIPLVAYEALTGVRLLTELFRGAGARLGVSHAELRWGMTRAQGVFEHPILFGLVCSAGFSMALHLHGRRTGATTRIGVALAPAAATFFSLSMGAWLSIMAQSALIVADRLTRSIPRRWTYVGVAAALLYGFVEVASNRGPVVIFLDLFSFNATASWTRVATFEYGMAAVRNNPLFGIGLREFPRPEWLTSSVDNFWLSILLAHGLPGGALIIGAFAWVFIRVGGAQIGDEDAARFRRGLLFALAGVSLSLCTVQVWKSALTFIILLLGASVWMLEGPTRSSARRASPRDAAAADAPLAPRPRTAL